MVNISQQEKDEGREGRKTESEKQAHGGCWEAESISLPPAEPWKSQYLMLSPGVSGLGPCWEKLAPFFHATGA